MAKGGKDGSAAAGYWLFGGLIVLGLVIKYWYVIVAMAVLVGVVFLASKWWERREQRLALERAANAALAARADRQHQQCLDGDQRGVYGQYLPTALGRTAGLEQA